LSAGRCTIHSIETVIAPTHPDLDEQIEEEFASGSISYDLISTHTEYAPSQRRWLTPLDEVPDDGELEPLSRRTLEPARIDGLLYGVPRNLDVKLLLYRTRSPNGAGAFSRRPRKPRSSHPST
jgi:multiple sugar transport system substrate-binding protein